MARDDDVSSRSQPDQPKRKLVLLVEDDPTDREIYGGLLWYNGFDVAQAEDGPSGLAMAREAAPDLILLDIMLPDGPDGIEVAGQLREAGVAVPIIALTARSEAELGEAAQKAGFAAFLEKPIDPFAVVREVIRWIGYPPGGGRAAEEPGDE